MTTLKNIAEKAKELHQVQDLEPNKFYDISSLGMKIETRNGFKPVKSIVRKLLPGNIVSFRSGATIDCATTHLFAAADGSFIEAAYLPPGIKIASAEGEEEVVAVKYSDTTEFFDLEVDSADHLYLTANGILHHNTGKTHSTEEIMTEFGFSEGSGYTKVAGSASPIGLYRLLYENRDGILMMDDADSALGDQEGRNLLKAAADTKRVRKVSWMKAGSTMVDPDDYDPETMSDKLPRSFEYKGQIIFISNLPLDKLDPDKALRTRAIVVDVDPTNQEIWDFFPKIIDKIPLDVDYPLKHEQRVQVVEWLRSRKMPEKTANIRILVRGLNILAGTLAGGGSSVEAEKFIKRFA